MESATVPLKQYEDLQQQYKDLQRRHDDTRKDYGECLIQLRRAEKKVKESNKAVRAWQDYIDRHPKYTAPRNKEKGSASPSRTKRGGSAAAPPSSTLPTFAGVLDRDITPQTGDRDNGSISPSSRPPAPTPLINEAGPSTSNFSKTSAGPGPEGRSCTGNPSSSQTTEGDLADGELGLRPIKAEPQSDDEPVVVSTRQVRKPRDEKVSSIHYPRTTGDYYNPHKIKREDDHTSQFMPYIPAVMPGLSHTQASDLDVVSHGIETPRKRQKISHTPDIRTSPNTTRFSPSRAAISDMQDENAAPVRGFNSASTNTHHTRQNRRKPTDDTANSQTSITSSRSSAGPLTPLSTNTPALPRTKASTSKARGDQRDSQAGLAHDDYTDDRPRDFLRSKNNPPQAKLAGLAKEITPPATKEVITPGAKTYRWRDFGQKTSPTQPTPPTIVKAEPQPAEQAPTPVRSSARQNRPSFIKASPPSDTRPDEEPLRSRPLSRLSLDDFRINSTYVGTSYAFNTSVRDRETRACLPGCTGPCCATLLRFADHDNPDHSRGRSRSRGDNDSDDETLLRSYLGHSDTAYLNAEQRASLLSAARAEKFAKQHGRHRQVFERRKTPPGFWRTEMPSTQEMEDDRAQARRNERAEVENRWREALKVGGNRRWRFRDEV